MTEQLQLPCGAIVPGCEYVAHGETPADVMAKIAEHSRNAHGVDHLSDALKTKIRTALEKQQPQ